MSKSIAEHFGVGRAHAVRDTRDTTLDALTRANTSNTYEYARDVKGVMDVPGIVGTVPGASCASRSTSAMVPTASPPVVPKPALYPDGFTVALGQKEYAVRFWVSETLDGQDIGFDTETAVVCGNEIPRLALASASTGGVTYLIHPDNVAEFLDLHRDRHLAFHNVAFDFWVLLAHLRGHGPAGSEAILWRMAEGNQLHDTMLLDELVRLAVDGTTPIPRNLAQVAQDWAGISDLNKDDPYRKRYGEIIGKPWGSVEGEFFEYAAKDPLATFLAYCELKARATALTLSASAYTWADCANRFGPLSEANQVKGAIGLAHVGRTGMYVDRQALERKDRKLAVGLRWCTRKLSRMPETEGLFKRNKAGAIALTKTGLPSMFEKKLQAILATVIQDNKSKGLPAVPITGEGLLSTSEADWGPYREHSKFVATWLALQSCAKMRQFTQVPEGERICPTYTVLVRTGRTSCAAPNLQQIPRSGGFRECFVASPGHYLFTIDYSYIELVTLAAICLRWYGKSQLAEVIRNGIDPHCYTAALITGMTLDEFMALKKTDPEKFKDLRQKAKALNFGIPGGLGAARLMDYARDNYGVILTKEQAEEWRSKVITEVYPELSLYLADRTMGVLAARLRCTVDELWNALHYYVDRPGWVPIVLRRVLGGENKADGSPYSTYVQDRIWSGLVRFCREPHYYHLLVTRKAGASLSLLCDDAAITPTGRVRAGVAYTECRNTPFQGLAADGAKVACFWLLMAGYRVVGFVHDEFIIELPVDADHAKAAAQIESIVVGAMSTVIDAQVPVRAEYALSTCWSKVAKLQRDAQGHLFPWSPGNV